MGYPNPLIAVSDIDDLFTSLYKDLLQGRGYSVLSMPNRMRLLTWLGEIKPDLIITGGEGVQTGGLEFLRMIKSDPLISIIPVVVVSKYPELESRAIELGAFEFVPKPFKVQEFLALVSKGLERSEKEKFRAGGPPRH